MEMTNNRVYSLPLIQESTEIESEYSSTVTVGKFPCGSYATAVSQSEESYYSAHPQLLTEPNEGPNGKKSDAKGELAQEELGANLSLIYSRHEKVNLVHFIDDPHSRQGFLMLVADLHVLLDLNDSRADVIMTKLLTKMIPGYQDSLHSMERLKDSIFTQDRLLQAGSRYEFENARIFGTLMSDPTLRNRLQDVHSRDKFRQMIFKRAEELASAMPRSVLSGSGNRQHVVRFSFMGGVIGDLRRRWPHYWSDYIDGVRDNKSIRKTLSCTMLLYFICLLPSIAFGVLNATHSDGVLTVEKVLLSQTLGGLTFAFFGGTTQIVLLTTAPLAIYTNIVFKLSRKFDVSFHDLYACVGLWNAFFLILYSVFGLSIVMRYSTRSSEEIFANFTSIAFAVDAFIATTDNFKEFYFAKECGEDYNRTAAVEALTLAYGNGSAGQEGGHKTLEEAVASLPQCHRDISILYLLLLLGTVWFSITLYNFTRTPYLTANKRELIADYSLPIAVVVMTGLSYLIFHDVNIAKSFTQSSSESLFRVADLSSMTVGAVFGSMGLGFCLSLLFFMDQNISAAMVNNPKNKIKKGTSYHWDLMVVALINLAPSLFTYPMVHAALPHSPLHLRALADVEENVLDGHVTETVVRVRETRLAAIFSHMLIGASVLLSSFLCYIPGAVLYGLFLYVAITPLYNNQMFERVLLLFTEEAAYPPTYYIRRVPQKKVHLFTLLQLVQLLALCVVGFIGFSFLTLFFPVLIFLLIPFRHYCLPLIVDLEYIKALDHDF